MITGSKYGQTSTADIDQLVKKERCSLKDILCPLKGRATNKFEVFGMDVETEHIRNDFLRKNGNCITAWKQDFVMGSIVGKDYKKVYWDREEMASALLHRRFRGSMIAATNLEFDFNQLYYDQINKFRLIYRHGLLAAVHSELDKNQGRKGRDWKFVESGNYMKASVASLGKMLGIPKLSQPSTMTPNPEGLGILSRRPRNTIEEQELEAYNVQDSTITYKFMESMKDFCTRHNMKMKLTIGSIGQDFWRRNHQKCGLMREPEWMLRKHFLGSFRGGCTQVLKRGYYHGKVYCYDYKSSYPGVMLKGVDGKGGYPHPGSYVHRDTSTIEDVERYEGICYAKVKAPYSYMPILGIRHNGRLLFPYGTFEGWFTNYELRKCMNQGYEVEPGEMTYYHTLFVPFAEAVKQLYKIRQDYKHYKKNPDGTWEEHPYEAMVKTLMNGGLFGKWGTNYLEMEEVKSADKLSFDNKGRAFYDGKPIDGKYSISNECLEHGLVSVKKTDCKPMRYSFPILSSYTTMLGRMKLLTAVKSNQESVLYDDTDSAYCTTKCFPEGEELGDWELQKEADGALIVRNKMYKLDVNDEPAVCKSKGVGKFMSKDADFMRAISTGRVSMERFTKMKESSRIGIKSGTVILFGKDLTLEDDKRDWQGKKFSIETLQDSKPLLMTNGLLSKELEKAQKESLLMMQREENARMNQYINSDLFDKKSVGSDISNEEFLRNEQFWGRKGEEH